MRETRTYGLTRGRTYPTRGVPLYSTQFDFERGLRMATAKRTKVNLEFLLVKAELKGIPEKGLLRMASGTGSSR